jgi:hypothetical protein
MKRIGFAGIKENPVNPVNPVNKDFLTPRLKVDPPSARFNLTIE